MLDEGGERGVAEDVLVGPVVALAEDAAEPLDGAAADDAVGVGALDARPGGDERLADVLGDGADVVPEAARRNAEGEVVVLAGEVLVAAGELQRAAVLLLVHVADTLEEDEREDVLLVAGGVDLAAEELGGAPEGALEFGEGHPAHGAPPFAPARSPSRRSRARKRSVAARTPARAASKSALTSA